MITPKSKLVRFKKKNIPSLLSAEWTLFGATFPPPLCKGMWKIFPAVCYWRIFTLYVFLKIPEKSLIYKFLATTGAHQKHISEYKTEQKTQTSKSSLYADSSDNLPSLLAVLNLSHLPPLCMKNKNSLRIRFHGPQLFRVFPSCRSD